MASWHQAIIPLINLATQLVQFKQVNNGGFVGLQIDFDLKFDGFMNSFREEARTVYEPSK
jgi:hypothetical protein